jgi:predicted dehydrogenase
MFRFGVLSTAAINQNVLLTPARKHADVEIAAVASRSLERGKTYARQHGIPRFYGNYEALIADPTLDVIYISTPNHLHASWVKRALQAGKHVLCEKPISYTLKDAKDIVALATAHNLLVMDALHYLYHPTIASTIERIKQGALGSIVNIHVELGYPNPPEGDIRYQPWVLGGAFMHMACYCGHLLHWLIKMPTHITRLHSTRHPQGADTLTWGALKAKGFDNEFTFRGSLEDKTLNSRVTVNGTEGDLTLYEIFNPTVPINGTLTDILRIEATKGEWPNPPYGRTSYDFQLETFMTCLRQQNYKPHVSLRSSAFVEEGRRIIYGREVPQEPL